MTQVTASCIRNSKHKLMIIKCVCACVCQVGSKLLHVTECFIQFTNFSFRSWLLNNVLSAMLKHCAIQQSDFNFNKCPTPVRIAVVKLSVISHFCHKLFWSILVWFVSNKASIEDSALQRCAAQVYVVDYKLPLQICVFSVSKPWTVTSTIIFPTYCLKDTSWIVVICNLS